GFSLFPKWPAQDPILAAWVFVGTMGLLIVPKLLAYVLLATQTLNRKKFGGALLVFAGLLVETLLSGLIAPVMMIFQSTAVGEILLRRHQGRPVQGRASVCLTALASVRKYSQADLLDVFYT